MDILIRYARNMKVVQKVVTDGIGHILFSPTIVTRLFNAYCFYNDRDTRFVTICFENSDFISHIPGFFLCNYL